MLVFLFACQLHLNFAFCCNILTKEKISFENDSIENCAFIEVRRFFIENTKWKTSMTLRGFAPVDVVQSIVFRLHLDTI